MPFKRKISQLRRLIKNLDRFIGESALKNSNIIEDAITEDQLFEKGIDGLGNRLFPYSPVTVGIKRLKGQPSDRTTLRDTGAFHKSIKVKLQRDGLLIDSDPIKEKTDLLEVYGEGILFLTEENFNDFKNNYLRDDLIKNIRAAL